MSENLELVNPLHPSVAERMDPQFAQIYNKYQAPRLRADQVTYSEYNADRSKYTFHIAKGPMPDVGNVKVHKVVVSNPAGEISVQVYVPTAEAIEKGGLKSKDGRLPAHVNYHGGGFVIGGLQSDESWCRQVCQAVGCIVLDVDYRLAPEYPHPVPLTDSWAALKWTFDSAEELGVDQSRVSIGGLSAGGQIAAVLALLAREDPQIPRLVLQILIVPLIDARFIPIEGSCDQSVPYESYLTNEFAPCLPLNRLRWFYNLWLGTDIEARNKKTADFRASPILASSHADLAPASIHVAGVDTLTSEGIAYHNVLTKAGTPSTLKVYEGCGHPFAHWDGELDKAEGIRSGYHHGVEEGLLTIAAIQLGHGYSVRLPPSCCEEASLVEFIYDAVEHNTPLHTKSREYKFLGTIRLFVICELDHSLFCVTLRGGFLASK